MLAASLYAGGWLYQQMSAGEENFHPDRKVNEQLNLIRRLANEGRNTEEILAEIVRRRVPHLDPEGGWSVELIGQIQRDYGLFHRDSES